jgi:hypothetical protein
LGGLLLAQLGAPTPQSAWVHAFYAAKTDKAERLPAGRIVVVAGSGSLFGVRTAEFQKRLGVPGINLSVHAGLGVDYILERAKRVLRPCDMVVLPLEYSLYSDTCLDTNVYVDYVVARDIPYFHSLPLLERLKTLFRIDMGRLQTGLTCAFFAKDAPPARGGFDLELLNEHGDYFGNTADLQTPEERKKLRNLLPDRHHFTQNAESVGYIQAFVSWCRANRIKVIASFPSYLRFEQYADDPFFKAVASFWEDLGVPMAGSPEAFMYPQELFFDTQYHLHSQGAAIHTQNLMDLLAPHVQHIQACSGGSEG